MGRLDAMELKVPSEVILKHKQQTRYQKGFEPFNKGKKQTEFMSQEAIERTKKNRFKKGHKPHNTNVVGAESIHTDKSGRQYLLVKIADSNWKLKSREVYKEHFGPIQENELVTYKDGNSLNCEPENLTLITKAENALKNRGHHFPSRTKSRNKRLKSIK